MFAQLGISPITVGVFGEQPQRGRCKLMRGPFFKVPRRIFQPVLKLRRIERVAKVVGNQLSGF